MDVSVVDGYSALIGLAAVVSTAIGLAAFRNRDSPEAKSLMVLGFATAVWCGFDLLSILSSSRTWTIYYAQIHWAGTALTPATMFVFVLYYTGREQLVNARTLVALYAVPIVVYVFVLTNEVHWLVWTAVEASPGEPSGFEFVHGPAFFVFILHAYLSMAVVTWFLFLFLTRTSGLYRGQTTAVLIAAVAGWIGNVLYVTGVASVDLTPIGFSIAATALGVAIFRYRLGDVVPVARDTVVDNITDGVIVLDNDDRVVDINPRGRELVGAPDVEICVGKPAAVALADPLPDQYGGETNVSDEITVETRQKTRHLAVDVSPLKDRRGKTIGRLFLVRDVTERRRNRRELERQNEQLDRFASVVSHDLRNPLNVADGYIQILKDRYDDSELTEVEHSHDRMARIIEDVLTLTRQGQAIDKTEEVALADLAHEAWNYVDTTDATLAVDVPDDHTVQADPSRLVQAFENLYRNAIDHVGEDVGVTVGVLSAAETAADRRYLDGPAGFYVEDDGPGIPADERDEVLEAGYTTSSDGTGLGLDIVKSIVEAHGWTLSVGEGSAGGARFVVQYTASAADEPVAKSQEAPVETG